MFRPVEMATLEQGDGQFQTPESHFLRKRTPFRIEATFIAKSWLSDS
jgi:hypothetical protein